MKNVVNKERGTMCAANRNKEVVQYYFYTEIKVQRGYLVRFRQTLSERRVLTSSPCP